MAKKLSSNVQQVIDTDNLSPFFLVKIDLNDGSIFHTNTPMDINVSGLGLFTADNTLMSIDAPRLSSIVDREVYKISYADNNFAFRNLFEIGMVGIDVTVFIGFYNTTDVTLGGVPPGQPLNAYEDLVIAYKGFVDSHGHTSIPDEDVSAVIECSSPMADLELTKIFLTSKDSMRQIAPQDSSFDFVYAGSKSVSLVWGKK